MTERTKKTDLMTEAERDAYHAEKMKKKKKLVKNHWSK